MAIHGYDIFHRIWDLFGEDASEDSYLLTPALIARALNWAQRDVALEMALQGAGWWEDESDTVSSISVAVGATSASLPSNFLMAKRLRTANGVVLWDRKENQYPRDGVRFVHDKLVWDTAAAAAETWYLEYARLPKDVRYGTLLSQAAGDASNVILPSSDNQGAVSATDDAYNEMSLSIIDGTASGQKGVVSDYTGSTRKLTLSAAFSTQAATGDEYVLMEAWPEAWAEALTYAAAVRLPEGSEVAGDLYAAAMGKARDFGGLRQGQQRRHTVYNDQA